jgi:hypothetical protein
MSLLSSTVRPIAQVEKILIAGAVIMGVYLIWKASRAVSSAVDTVAQPAAEALVRIRSGPAAAVRGTVRFPSGASQTLDDILAAGGHTEWVNGALYLTYQGRSYEITSPRDGSGNYEAVPV